MAALTTQTPLIAGQSISYVAAGAGGDTISPSDGKTFLHVKNGGGSSITVTITAHGMCNQGFTHNAIVTVAAAADEAIGPFDTQRFSNGTGGIDVTYSGVTTVTVAAIRTA